MKEVVEFFTAMRASEKERFESMKKFMSESINALRDVTQVIKQNAEYLRESLEKLKEITMDNLSAIRTQSGADSILKARKALDESLEIFQRTIQVMEYQKTLQEISRFIEVKKLKKLDSKLSRFKRPIEKKEE